MWFVVDAKLQSMVKSADAYITRANEQQLRNDFSSSLVCCQQAISKQKCRNLLSEHQ